MQLSKKRCLNENKIKAFKVPNFFFAFNEGDINDLNVLNILIILFG